jgi:hypothetical protein
MLFMLFRAKGKTDTERQSNAFTPSPLGIDERNLVSPFRREIAAAAAENRSRPSAFDTLALYGSAEIVPSAGFLVLPGDHDLHLAFSAGELLKVGGRIPPRPVNMQNPKMQKKALKNGAKPRFKMSHAT